MKIINESIKKKSFQYLQTLRGSECKEIFNKESQIGNYLMPSEENLNISEKRFMFAIRNRMIPIEANFPNKNQKKGERCEKCGEIEETRIHM